MYFANCTRPNVAFIVNLLVRYSSTPIKRHWNHYQKTREKQRNYRRTICRYIPTE
jgi:hypothetical protein